MNNRRNKALKKLFFNDMIIGTCFWSLVLIIVLPFLPLPQSLSITLTIFFFTVGVFCLPFCLYKIYTALHLAKNGVEITATNVSIVQSLFGNKVTFEYEHDGKKYFKSKFFYFIFIPEQDSIKLLIEPAKPSKFIIVEFKKKSVFSVVKERNS
jgi:hypothetical protein